MKRKKILREDILAAGQELMFLKGFGATGIKEITEKVSIPKGSFYNHFASKEAFGREVIRRYCDNGVEMYKKRLLDPSVSPIQRLESFFDRITERYEKVSECKLGCLLGNFSQEMADVDEGFREETSKGFNDHEAVMVQCIKEALELGEIRDDLDAQQTGSFVLNGWHGALVRMKSEGTTKPLRDFKEMALKLLAK